MKRITTIFVSVLLLIGLISGCVNNPKEPEVVPSVVDDQCDHVVIALERCKDSTEEYTKVYLYNGSTLVLNGHMELSIGAHYGFIFYDDEWHISWVRW